MKRENLSIILTALGTIGTIASAVMAAIDTPNAVDILDRHRLEIDPTGETDLTLKEKVIDYAKGYWKTGLIVLGTTACNIGSCALSTSSLKKAAIATGLGAAIGGKYKDEAVKLFGEEKARLLENSVKKEIKSDEFMTKKVWFQESVSGEFFQATWRDIYESEYELNKKIATEGWGSIGDLFPTLKRKCPKTAEWCWSEDMLVCDYGYPWVDFTHHKMNGPGSEDSPNGIDWKFNDGRETYIINYGIYPMPPLQIKDMGYMGPLDE